MDAAILKASAVGAKHFTLDNKKLNAVPKTIGRLESVEMLSMKSNKITKLPPELGLLRNVSPTCLFYFVHLREPYDTGPFSIHS
jgi:hypothetical protein